MRRNIAVHIYLTDEENEKLKNHISQNTNGDGTSISTYLRKLILHHINTQPLSTSPPPPAVAPIVESSQTLKVGDLDW